LVPLGGGYPLLDQLDKSTTSSRSIRSARAQACLAVVGRDDHIAIAAAIVVDCRDTAPDPD
jgi:hypothetical protein